LARVSRAAINNNSIAKKGKASTSHRRARRGSAWGAGAAGAVIVNSWRRSMFEQTGRG
jgi:hypothetical protein